MDHLCGLEGLAPGAKGADLSEVESGSLGGGGGGGGGMKIGAGTGPVCEGTQRQSGPIVLFLSHSLFCCYRNSIQM